MKIYKDIISAHIVNPYVTVGIFDGVHLGHQFIFSHLIELASRNNGQSVVITFWPHPKMVVEESADELMMITTIEEKIQIIENLGIEHLIILPFTREFSQLTSEEFIEKYLYKALKIKGLVVGFDHKFGKDREGNFEVLNHFAQKYQFELLKVNALSINNQNISSTIIRNALLNGEIELANTFLSRNFTISGKVCEGKKIGRDLGFPTANIQLDFKYKLIPRNGVYAVIVNINGNSYIGMLNIGTRPTFNQIDKNKSIEVHILDFDSDIYNEILQLSFYKRMRSEMKFNSLTELIAQLKIDKQNIEYYFANSDINISK